MKKILAGLAAVVFAAPLIVSAQTTRPAAKPARDTARDTQAPAWKHAGLHETKDIIGTRIKNAEGKDLGEIDQLLIDRNGKVSHVVIGVGGLAGVGEKKVVVAWSDLKFAPVTEGKKNAITMDEAKLERAPRSHRQGPGGPVQKVTWKFRQPHSAGPRRRVRHSSSRHESSTEDSNEQRCIRRLVETGAWAGEVLVGPAHRRRVGQDRRGVREACRNPAGAVRLVARAS